MHVRRNSSLAKACIRSGAAALAQAMGLWDVSTCDHRGHTARVAKVWDDCDKLCRHRWTRSNLEEPIVVTKSEVLIQP